MKITMVGDSVPENRAEAIAKAKENAAEIGTKHEDGSVSVYVKDADAEMVLSTKGLKHGIDRRFDENAGVTVKAGEIIANSIKVNEMTPKLQNAVKSYVLIGAAKEKNGTLYVVRSVVNRFELVSIDVLYAVNAKSDIKKGSRPGITPRGPQ